MKIAVAISLYCMISSVCGYSTGAPEYACSDMTPQHHVLPQASSAPYRIVLSVTKLHRNDIKPVMVRIEGVSSTDTIKGFMIQARKGHTPVGKFKVTRNSQKHAQILHCSGGFGNVLTHKYIHGSGPTTIESQWVAPVGVTGEVKFYATVALNGGVFWVGKIKESLNIQ